MANGEIIFMVIIFSEDVRELGFTVLIDMRGNSSWSTVKPILKVLQDYFSSAIHTAHIIKPDNFWQKQRTNLGSQKYKFEVGVLIFCRYEVISFSILQFNINVSYPMKYEVMSFGQLSLLDRFECVGFSNIHRLKTLNQY